MRFGVIYEIDCQRRDSIEPWLPPNPRLFKLTEKDDQADCAGWGPGWKNAKHRKFVGEISRKQFDELVDKLNLRADSTPTMGSLGVPWTASGFGVAPAIAFNEDTYEKTAYIQAYVTPLPEVGMRENRAPDYYERCWERVRAVILKLYGRGRR